ncbi:putative quinol monooxygenase [Lutimaribacter marinistellae]|uniref:Quinol monooxygenase n=1 Tax=Lutimaribacter marinistellae TaxID=1820329 RepID=A0ABV7TLF2_9RHOB
MDQTLKIIARMVATPGQADRLVDHMKQLVEDTRKEAGCLSYDLFRGTDDPDVLIFVEEWKTRESWEAHMAGEAIQSFNARIGNGAFANGEVHPLQQIS